MPCSYILCVPTSQALIRSPLPQSTYIRIAAVHHSALILRRVPGHQPWTLPTPPYVGKEYSELVEAAEKSTHATETLRKEAIATALQRSQTREYDTGTFSSYGLALVGEEVTRLALVVPGQNCENA